MRRSELPTVRVVDLDSHRTLLYHVYCRPTFIRQYEETFQSGQPPDKHWLGLLNQVRRTMLRS